MAMKAACTIKIRFYATGFDGYSQRRALAGYPVNM
jgi:hypothetical protein